MKENEIKKPVTPLQKLITNFQERDVLLQMRINEPRDKIADDNTYSLLMDGLNADLIGLADEHPELFLEANPVVLRANLARLAIKYNFDHGIYDTIPKTTGTGDDLPHSLFDADYSNKSIFEQLPETQQEQLNELYTGLLGSEVIDTYAEQVHSQKEAAEKLGLNEQDVESAYGMLSAIEDGFVDGGGRIEFVVLDLSKDKLKLGEGDGPTGIDRVTRLGEFVDYKYLARIRYTSSGSRLSIVLDIVPPQINNAAFILRGDDGSLDTDKFIPKNKADAQKSHGRRVYHTKSGEAGLLNRINQALTMPYDHFLDKENHHLRS